MPNQTVIYSVTDGWCAEARKYLEQRIQFVIADPTDEAVGICIKLAVEFEYMLVQEWEPHRLVLVPVPKGL